MSLSTLCTFYIFICQFEESFDFNHPHFEKFPGHKMFLQLLNEGKETAAKNRSRVYVNWRGYRVFVNPGKKNLDRNEFLRHLIVALKTIKPISVEEEKVIYMSRRKKKTTFSPYISLAKIGLLNFFLTLV